MAEVKLLLNKKMPDQVNTNDIQVHPECCVCLELAEVKARTPCNHPEPICEPCFQKVLHCPLCRTPFNNGVTPIEFSDDEQFPV